MSNTLPKTTSATVHGITDAVTLFTRLDHDGWSVQMSTASWVDKSYHIIVVNIPEIIFESICESLGIRNSVEIDY